MKFCPVWPGYPQYSKLFINYVLQLHVKIFISPGQDPSFILRVSHVIASARLSGMKKLIKNYQFQYIEDISIVYLRPV